MKRAASVLMAVAVVVATMGSLPAVGAASAAIPGIVAESAASNAAIVASNHTANATNGSTPPGAILSGSVGVQKAEIEGVVETRAFGLAVARSATNATRADVIREEVSRLQQRLDELRERKRALDRARENGSIDNATYRARVAEIAARAETTRTLANMSENATRGLPEELLESRGINVTAIQRLQREAANLTGPEVAAIARQIAGPGVGRSIAGGPPVDVGPPREVGPGGGNETGAPDGVGNGTRGGAGDDARNRTGGNETRTPSEGPGDGEDGDSGPGAGGGGRSGSGR